MSGAFVVLSSGTAAANNAELVVDYRCTSGPEGIARNGSVDLRTTVSIPTTLSVGQPLSIGWAIGYKPGTSRFGSPDYFAAQGKVSVIGNLQLSGGWIGVLQPTGSLTQAGPLQPGTVLELPPSISDSAHTDRAAKVRITPQRLYVDFTPPEGEVMVNDDDPRVKYFPFPGNWYDLNDQPPNANDHHHDLHRTNTPGASASFEFTGTGIEYVARRDKDAGRVFFKIDGKVATPSYVDASKEPNGDPTNSSTEGGQTLWSFRGLDYGKHTIEIVDDGTDDKWTQLDAFRVITEELPSPPPQYRATCVLLSAPVAVDVTISDAPTATPTNTGTGTATPTGTSSPTGSTSPSPSGSGSPSPSGSNSNKSSSTPSASSSAAGTTPKPTLTVTTVVTPTRATPTTPQVTVIPQGGADTGVGPEQERPGLALVGAGSAMALGSVLGGVALKRRRSAHSGGRG
ncbi:hypothetical protein ACFFMN_09975 [Planobispora siamensis]|uniref:hypothetical protein n=1 Tax=Planobispora siamensis TaxID=936338 RepID=UPI00194F04DA|nr:hypothetical protein [Planobispora siamensis]